MSDDFFLVQSLPPHASFRLRPDSTYVLGRSTRCQMVVNNQTVSRRHAEISVTGTVVHVLDLDSRNGTFIDDKRIKAGELRLGQTLTLGGVSFVLSTTTPPQEAFDSKVDTARVGQIRQATSGPTNPDLGAERDGPFARSITSASSSPNNPAIARPGSPQNPGDQPQVEDGHVALAAFDRAKKVRCNSQRSASWACVSPRVVRSSRDGGRSPAENARSS